MYKDLIWFHFDGDNGAVYWNGFTEMFTSEFSQNLVRYPYVLFYSYGNCEVFGLQGLHCLTLVVKLAPNSDFCLAKEFGAERGTNLQQVKG